MLLPSSLSPPKTAPWRPPPCDPTLPRVQCQNLPALAGCQLCPAVPNHATEEGKAQTGVPVPWQCSEWYPGSVLRDGINPAPTSPWQSRASPALSLERMQWDPAAQPPPRVQAGTKQAVLWRGAGVADAQGGGRGSAFPQHPGLSPQVRRGGLGPAHFPPPQGCAMPTTAQHLPRVSAFPGASTPLGLLGRRGPLPAREALSGNPDPGGRELVSSF